MFYSYFSYVLRVSTIVVSITAMMPIPKGAAQDSAPKEWETHRSLAQLMREKSMNLPQDSIRRDYVLEDAKLQAMIARYEAAKGFNPETREIPQLVIDNAIKNDPAIVTQQSFIDSLTTKIEGRAKVVGPNDTTLQNWNTLLLEAKEELSSLEKTLATTKRKELQEQLKVKFQENLWTMEAEIESQKALVKILAEKVSQQKDAASDQAETTAAIKFLEERMARDNRVLDKITGRIAVLRAEAGEPEEAVAQTPTSWSQVLFAEQIKLLRLKAELAVMKQELEETVEYSEEELGEHRLNRRGPMPPEEHEGLLKNLEVARKILLRQSIRATERTIRVSETMIEELKKKCGTPIL